MNKTNRDFCLDFVRLIATTGVIIFHYSVYSNYTFKTNFNFLNPLFFMMSGFLCYKKYTKFSDFIDVKKFYKDKILRVFPLFYLVWFFFHIKTIIVNHAGFFYAGKPQNIVFTILGVDGYLSKRFTTYYQVGEWFLGAIIICFLIYPLINLFYKKNKYLTLIVLFSFCSLYNHLQLPTISIVFPNVFDCLFKFSLGFLFFDAQKIFNKKYFLISSISFVFVYNHFKVANAFLIIDSLYYFLYFVILYIFGGYVTKNKYVQDIVKCVSYNSFVTLLVQHKIILFFLSLYNPNNAQNSISYLATVIIVSYITAFLINCLFNYAIRIFNTIRMNN